MQFYTANCIVGSSLRLFICSRRRLYPITTYLLSGFERGKYSAKFVPQGKLISLTFTTLYSPKNVYANMEIGTKPHSLDFNVLNPRKWAPFHTEQDVTSIQEETLQYIHPNHAYARELQDDLRESIKSAMREWRRTTTSFRTDIVSKLVSILEVNEQAKVSGKEQSCPPLEVNSKTRSVFGFALHFNTPLTSTDDIMEKIKSTEIHNNRNPNVEFSIAVRVFAYPGGVMSIWIYICSSVPK
jgi:hypothetical protein